MRKNLKTLWIITLGLVAAACDRVAENPVAPRSSLYTVNGSVLDNGSRAAGVKVLVMVESGRDVETLTDAQGAFSANIPISERITGIVAAASFKSGFADMDKGLKQVAIQLQSVPKLAERALVQATAQELWYGRYDEQDGNLRFRYQYTFNRFVCINWMPRLFPYTISPDPNKWTSWDLTDFLPTYKGKKLLVPTRYRWWHGAVYGYSISLALYLIATR